MKEHAPHRWEQRGRCVWCADCDVRLYQGRVPANGDQHAMVESLDALGELFQKMGRQHALRGGTR